MDRRDRLVDYDLCISIKKEKVFFFFKVLCLKRSSEKVCKFSTAQSLLCRISARVVSAL